MSFLPPVSTTGLLLCSARSTSTGCPGVFFGSPWVTAAGKKERKKPRSPGIPRSPQSPSPTSFSQKTGAFSVQKNIPLHSIPPEGGRPTLHPSAKTIGAQREQAEVTAPPSYGAQPGRGAGWDQDPRSAMNYSRGAAEPQPSEDLPVHSRSGDDLQLGPAQLAACLLQTDPSEPAQVLPSTN